MKNFLIGVVVGIVLAGTGTYAIIKEKAKKVATKENATKVARAAQHFVDVIEDIAEK